MKISDCLTQLGAQMLQTYGSNPEGINQYTDGGGAGQDADNSSRAALSVGQKVGYSSDKDQNKVAEYSHRTATDSHAKASKVSVKGSATKVHHDSKVEYHKRMAEYYKSKSI